MVRLKVYQVGISLKPLRGFNSNMVRLKESFVAFGPTFTGCFNSNMVRLKDYNNYNQLQLNREFQFQYGTIKRS